MKPSRSVSRIAFLSTGDSSMQPTLFSPARNSAPRPLAVCLHTWSADLSQPFDEYMEQCEALDWHFLFPAFRGPNWTPEACGSPLVIADLESAVKFVCDRYAVDTERIYLAGGSGGGHAALLMAGTRPELFTAISAWCPITDLAAWHDQSLTRRNEYAEHIRRACGGDPGCVRSAAQEAEKRSPLTYLGAAKNRVILDIAAGIHDGHTGSVPVSHSIDAFNLLAEEADRISPADEQYIVENERVPESLAFSGADPAFDAGRRVLLRRISGKVRLTLFNSGHDMLHPAAFGFLAQQKRGMAPVWDSGTLTGHGTGALSR
ncbi:MAG: prolyl oligopeptidase family serine peptidase [Lentisphaeria bacterium]|nr:prolyl oligopeptidase family serine peptidase [Lentisphaeria bacterium]